MKRPRQHVIDSMGEAQLRSVFEPLGWTVNRVEKDYGIDFEVEVFRDSSSTGMTFKVQLKSSDATKYSVGGEFVFARLNISNALRLADELHTPVILIHADTRQRRNFWSAPQLNVDAAELARKSGNKSITFRIPASNELPGTVSELIEIVVQIERLFASRLIIATPILDFVASVHGRIEPLSLIRQFKEKGDAMRLMRSQDLFLAGSLDEAQSEIKKVLADSESSVEIKFWAVLWAERFELVALARADAPQAQWPILRLSTGDKLRMLAKNGPRQLKLFAVIAKKAAELDQLVHRDHGLNMNWRLNEKRGDQLWEAHLAFELTISYRRVVLKYNQCIRLVQYGVNSEHRWVLSPVLVRIVHAVSPFIFRLTSQDMNEVADRVSASALQLCRLAAAIADDNRDWDAACFAITAGLLTKRDPNSEAWAWVRDAITTIKDPRARKHAEQLIDSHTRRIRGEQLHGDIKTTARQIYENMAAALGIDLSNPNDPFADIVRIGLEDLDPSRVLRHCEHIFTTLGARTAIIAPLGLPTAGDKVIHCDLHKYAAEGLVLDEVFAFFKERYCDSCPDCSPRPMTWAYSEAWQKEENARHIEFMRDFEKRTGRVTVDGFE